MVAFVPEQQTDFIFTVAGEELGFIGSGFIIFLLFLVLMRAFGIARRATDPYGTLVCTGVIAWFAFQIFENIGMTLGLDADDGRSASIPFLWRIEHVCQPHWLWPFAERSRKPAQRKSRSK